jgi:hypothetical protein
MTAHEPSGRVDEDDHDLLTFGEAGARLRENIAQTREQIADLESNRDFAGLARARDRLAQLEDSAARNSAQPINDETFEKFFGYPGKARRNTS